MEHIPFRTVISSMARLLLSVLLGAAASASGTNSTLRATSSGPRMAAYVTSWEEAPTGDQLKDVTDVMLAFGCAAYVCMCQDMPRPS